MIDIKPIPSSAEVVSKDASKAKAPNLCIVVIRQGNQEYLRAEEYADVKLHILERQRPVPM
jgi:hypothetical protein